MDKKISFAKKFPITLAIISGVFVASYMFTGLQTESIIGRPSSTHAIGYLFAPIYSVIVFIIAYLIGLIFKYFLLKRGEIDLVNKSNYLRNSAIITIILGIFSGGTAYLQVAEHVEFNAPGLISNSASFKKTKYSELEIPSVTKSSELLWEFDNTNHPPIKWHNKLLKFNVINSFFMGILSEQNTEASYDFSGYTYLKKIEALALNKYLVVLVKLRATSSRSMLLIYDKEYNLLYEELLDRCGRKQYVGTTSDIDGEVLVVNICEPFILNINEKA